MSDLHSDPQIAVSRRNLMRLGAGVVGAAAVTAMPRPVAATPEPASCPREGYYEMRIDDQALLPREHIGIQLYTIRNTVRRQGYRKVFTRLANIGYTQVEFAGYDTEDATLTGGLAELREIMDELGLQGGGAHLQGAISDSTIDTHIAQAKALGIPYIGIPSMPQTYSQSAVDNWNRWGARARDAGLKLYLHNHSYEMSTFDANGTSPYEHFLANTDPEFVFFEMDIFWAYNASRVNPHIDPVRIAVENRERYVLFHVKDGHAPGNGVPEPTFQGIFNSSGGYVMTHMGQGDIDYEHFFNELRNADMAAGLSGDGRNRGYMMENDVPTDQNNTKYAWVTAVTGHAWMVHGLRKSS